MFPRVEQTHYKIKRLKTFDVSMSLITKKNYSFNFFKTCKCPNVPMNKTNSLLNQMPQNTQCPNVPDNKKQTIHSIFSLKHSMSQCPS